MLTDLFRIDGKVAVVTGADTGIGQAIATGLCQAGADIVGVARKSLDETKKLVEEYGARFYGVNADLSDRNSIELILNETLKAFGRTDILVNNAGMTRRNEATDLSWQDWDNVVEVNQNAPFFLSQAFAKQFIKQGEGGKIINICSIRSFKGGNGVIAYTATKTALMGMTKTLANELAPHAINVNAIAPGFIKTAITEGLRSDQTKNQEILSSIPQHRWGTPQDLQGSALFLASKASDYVNGHVLVVDGGLLA
jgi:2-deoxy-D-gluconate 3-dehydrogenase